MLDSKNRDMAEDIRMFDLHAPCSAAEIKNKLNKLDADMIFYIPYHLRTKISILVGPILFRTFE